MAQPRLRRPSSPTPSPPRRDAELIYLDHALVLAAADDGFDLIAAFHAAGRRVDAYTIRRADAAGLAAARRLLDLRVDQITTDDPRASPPSLGLS